MITGAADDAKRAAPKDALLALLKLDFVEIELLASNRGLELGLGLGQALGEKARLLLLLRALRGALLVESSDLVLDRPEGLEGGVDEEDYLGWRVGRGGLGLSLSLSLSPSLSTPPIPT